MIAEMVSRLTSGALVAASDDGGPTWLLILGPAGAGGLYFWLWSFYRNTGKSHSFERETRIDAKPVTGHETKVDEIKGTKRSSIEGGNHTNHRQRVQRF
jgi:hypothetical protein